MDEQTISLQDLLESPLDFSSLQLPTSSGASSESDEGWDWPTRQRKCLIAGLSGRGDRVALEITRRGNPEGWATQFPKNWGWWTWMLRE